MRYWLLIFLLIPVFAGAQNPYPADKDRNPRIEEIFSVKETFLYEVKYSFLRLGWVEVSLLSDTLYNGTVHKHMMTEIRSNPKILFVGKEQDQFNSLFFVNAEGLPATSLYWKDNVDEGKYDEIRYKFDRENGVVTYREKDGTRDTLNLVEPATAGQLIFYFSRLYAGSDSEFTMPVYTDKKGGAIIMDNPSKKELRTYAAFDEPVETYMSSGQTANIEGPFGFSGKFKAYYLADDLRVPLEARVKVFFGNAIIRLIEYKREEL